MSLQNLRNGKSNDNGIEYMNNEFLKFCEEHDIKSMVSSTIEANEAVAYGPQVEKDLQILTKRVIFFIVIVLIKPKY